MIYIQGKEGDTEICFLMKKFIKQNIARDCRGSPSESRINF